MYNNSMNIFILFNHPAPYKIKLFNGISETHDVHVIFERMKNKDRNRLFYDENKTKFKIHPIKGINISDENHFSLGAVNHLKRHRYDLIIINGYSTLTEMLVLNYLKRKKIPYAFYINGGVAKKESRLKFLIKRHFLSGAEFYFSPAENADEYLLKYGVEKASIYHYPYSTIYQSQIAKLPLTKEEKEAFWKSKNIPGNKIFVTVTSFIKRKNNFSLIKTWVNMPKDYTLVLIGDGKEKQLYQKYMKEHHLNNVLLLPFMKSCDALDYVRHADGALYISRYDIYGHVINEALAMGTNVLASNRMVATRQLIVNRVNGLVYDYADCLKDKIIELVKYDFFDEAIKTASENTIEKMVKRHLEIIEVAK